MSVSINLANERMHFRYIVGCRVYIREINYSIGTIHYEVTGKNEFLTHKIHGFGIKAPKISQALECPLFGQQ